MNTPVLMLLVVAVVILTANMNVMRNLHEVDVQCTEDRIVSQRSKLIVTNIVDSVSYTIHSGDNITVYRLPKGCAFSSSPKNYLNEKWGNQ